MKRVDLAVDDLEAVAPEWGPPGRLMDPIQSVAAVVDGALEDSVTGWGGGGGSRGGGAGRVSTMSLSSGVSV